MQLLLRSDDGTTVVVAEDFGGYLEHGLLTVKLDHVAPLLTRIHDAVAAVVSSDDPLLQTDPARLAQISQEIVGVASAARAVAEAAIAADPTDTNAQQLLGTLAALSL